MCCNVYDEVTDFEVYESIQNIQIWVSWEVKFYFIPNRFLIKYAIAVKTHILFGIHFILMMVTGIFGIADWNALTISWHQIVVNTPKT